MRNTPQQLAARLRRLARPTMPFRERLRRMSDEELWELTDEALAAIPDDSWMRPLLLEAAAKAQSARVVAANRSRGR